MVYENIKVQGPYLRKTDNRLIVIITKENGKKSTISYPKYLLECHLNRYLNDNETVHHIDGNPLNNELSNLEILDRKEHINQDVIRNKDLTVQCAYCGKTFIIPGNKLNNRNRKDRNTAGYFCSKKCSGKYGAMKQHHNIIISNNKVKTEHYKLNQFKLKVK